MQRRLALSLAQALSLLVLTTSNLLAVDQVEDWKWTNPTPNGNNINAVTYAAGLIVGVGNAGTIMTSTNVEETWWTQVPLGTNTSTLSAITYGNSTFVIGMGDSVDGDKTKRFLTSTDGANWSTQTWTNKDTRAVKALAYGAGLFVAGTERGQLWTSPDGTNWTQSYAGGGSSHNFNGITYLPDIGFVAVGDANSDVGNVAEIRTSPDGINWSLQGSGAPASTLVAITWGWATNENSTTNFVAVGSNGTISTSPDGTNWTSQASGTAVKLYGVAFKPGVGYIAAGVGAVIQTSPDGTNWYNSYSDISNPVNVPGNDFKGAVYAADLGYFIGVGNSGEVETSPTGDGGTWAAAFRGRPENLYGVARGAENFVVVGNIVPYSPNYGVVLTSPSGSNWRVRNSNCAARINNVAYGAGTFVAVANSGIIVTSTDEGTNWVVQYSGVAANLTGVSYITNSVTNIFLVAGATGTILTSPDGVNWTVETSGSTANLYCSCPTYAAGVYVVAGASGTILTSPDATTWTAQTSGITRDINGIAYANGNFVAACSYGYILTSPDGVTWTRQTSPLGSDNSSSRAYSAITYVDGQFVIAGSTTSFPQSAILTSTNGTNWVIAAKPQSTNPFKALAHAPGAYVGIGNGGMVMTALTVQPLVIQYSFDPTNGLTLTWPGGGSLLASPDVSGTYTNVPDAVSPYVVTPLSEPALFYRVQQP